VVAVRARSNRLSWVFGAPSLQARSRLLRLMDLWRSPGQRNRLRRPFSPPACAQLNAGLRRASSRPLRCKIATSAGPALALRPFGCAGPAPAMDGPP